jgi:hypothetical protein
MIGSTVTIDDLGRRENLMQGLFLINHRSLVELIRDWAGGWRVRRGVFVRGARGPAGQP